MGMNKSNTVAACKITFPIISQTVHLRIHVYWDFFAYIIEYIFTMTSESLCILYILIDMGKDISSYWSVTEIVDNSRLLLKYTT